MSVFVELTEGALAGLFADMLPHLDERQRRLLLGAQARALGRGGIRAVSRAALAREATVSAGARELEAGTGPLGRVRRPGGGRKRAAEIDPGLVPALLALVEPDMRGDPMSPLRWTTKSTRKLAAELTRQGHRAGADTVGDLLREQGFSLQGNSRVIEGRQHGDRDAQFRYINGQVKDHRDSGDPVISVDTKKKERAGNYANAGREYAPKGRPVPVRDHDFADPRDPRAIPYGIYDLAASTGWVNVGTDADTAAFAIEPVRRWWQDQGHAGYPAARRLLVTADAGGSNGYRTRAWKTGLAGLAAETGLEITCCHFPPGTSKWNKIEHRLFAHITMNWRGRPLTSHEVIVSTIAATTTATGLTVHAELDTNSYDTGIQVSDQQMSALPLTRHDWHGDWNYTLRPEPPAPPPPPPPSGPGHAAWAHPALTGLTPAAWDQLITSLHARAGDPPASRRTALNLAEQTLATVLGLRFRPPPAALAQLFGVTASTIRSAQRRIWPLLVQAGYPTELAGPKITTLAGLTAYAQENGLTITPSPAMHTLSNTQHPKPAC
jgi:hypothetical protein